MENIMMYNEKLVAVIKCGGKVMREIDGCIYIPFGSEYTVAINNLNVRKAVVNITIDGVDVLDGQSLIVGADSKAHVEGFLKDKRVSNKFKFIEKTSKIEEFRGNKPQDGLVRVTYRFEADTVWNYPTVTHTYNPNCPYDTFFASVSTTRSSSSTQNNSNTPRRVKSKSAGDVGTSTGSTVMFACSKSVNEDGITGKGGASSQKFNTGTVGALEWQEHTIVLQLKGKTRKSRVDKPVSVKTKVKCTLCGKKNKIKANYCGECGNALVMFLNK